AHTMLTPQRAKLRVTLTLRFWSLILVMALAAFAVITPEILVMGVPPAMATDLDSSSAPAGLLLSASRLVVALSGPFPTPHATRFGRRVLLTGILVVFGPSNRAAASAQDRLATAVARMIPATLVSVFRALVSGTASKRARPEQGGRCQLFSRHHRRDRFRQRSRHGFGDFGGMARDA
ncbi:MAG: hypothetical protein AAF281_15425, partial [Pseudomonadota bacterium]